MSYREKTVIAILLLVARMICGDKEREKEIKNLATHISIHAKEAPPDA